MKKSVVVVGLGAIGTLYATKFHDCIGIELRIALDIQRLPKYRNNGVVFNGQKYDFDYFTPSFDDDFKADLILLTTKSSGLNDALKLIEPIVGENTQIIPLLNGITSEEITADKYGWDRVLYGYFIGHTSTRSGNSITQDGAYHTYFGEATNEAPLSSRVEDVTTIFDLAHVSYRVPKSMVDSLWQKYIVNIGMNQATALLRCTYGHLQRNSLAHEIMLEMMNEAAAVGQAHGIANTDKMVEKACSMLLDLRSWDGSSMYQDVIAGRKTEVDIFASHICELGRKYGIETPGNQAAEKIFNAMPLN